MKAALLAARTICDKFDPPFSVGGCAAFDTRSRVLTSLAPAFAYLSVSRKSTYDHPLKSSLADHMDTLPAFAPLKRTSPKLVDEPENTNEAGKSAKGKDKKKQEVIPPTPEPEPMEASSEADEEFVKLENERDRALGRILQRDQTRQRQVWMECVDADPELVAAFMRLFDVSLISFTEKQELIRQLEAASLAATISGAVAVRPNSDHENLQRTKPTTAKLRR